MGGMEIVTALAERRLVPAGVVRLGARALLQHRLDQEWELHQQRYGLKLSQYVKELEQQPSLAVRPEIRSYALNLPAAFYQKILGPQLLLGSAYWPEDVVGLGAAEEAQLAQIARRADIRDQQSILDLGCGLGAATLWMAGQFPESQVTAWAFTAAQREFVAQRAREMGRGNVTVIGGSLDDLRLEQKFDRIVSVEFLEEAVNIGRIFQQLAGLLKPGGQLFVQLACHWRLAYRFAADGASWVGRHFLAGRQVLSEDLLLYFQKDLGFRKLWRINGGHYQRTAAAWRANLEQRRADVLPILSAHFDASSAQRWYQRWRLLLLAAEEMFGYRNGDEWYPAQYLFCRLGAVGAAPGDAGRAAKKGGGREAPSKSRSSILRRVRPGKGDD